jgi:hypothetical protein
VTLLRVRGNTVRIGIEAPREVRVVRGELAEPAPSAGSGDGVASEEDELPELGQREQAFAHAEPPRTTKRRPLADRPWTDQPTASASVSRSGAASAPAAVPGLATSGKHELRSQTARQVKRPTPRIFVGRVFQTGDRVDLRPELQD